MNIQSPYLTYKRFRSIQTGYISVLPVVILMPHSACNCRCIMCDIWKGNHQLKQLTESDIRSLLNSLQQFETRRILMTGGEAILNPNFFRLCEILQNQNIKISLHSTGLTIGKHSEQIVKFVNDIILSLDGDEMTHDRIRNIPGAFSKMAKGIQTIRTLNPIFPISGRSVIQKENFRIWPGIVQAAKDIGLNSISFLPADVSSEAFNRTQAWSPGKKMEILPDVDELNEFGEMVELICRNNQADFENHFIVETPEKIRRMYTYYSAIYGLNEFPYKKCNAPWVSTVIEADGTIRPCFFHHGIGNIKDGPLDETINSRTAVDFRKKLDVNKSETCVKCVCYLNLRPYAII